MIDAEQLTELMNRASTATPISRLSQAEQRVVFTWLADNGFITWTGKRLEPAPQRIKPHAYTAEGKPIWKR
jgi:hypothetical protein